MSDLTGLRLGDLFYFEAVKPILTAILPDQEYGAALVGSGSEVMGFGGVSKRGVRREWVALTAHDSFRDSR